MLTEDTVMCLSPSNNTIPQGYYITMTVLVSLYQSGPGRSYQTIMVFCWQISNTICAKVLTGHDIHIVPVFFHIQGWIPQGIFTNRKGGSNSSLLGQSSNVPIMVPIFQEQHWGNHFVLQQEGAGTKGSHRKQKCLPSMKIFPRIGTLSAWGKRNNFQLNGTHKVLSIYCEEEGINLGHLFQNGKYVTAQLDTFMGQSLHVFTHK